MSTYPHQQAIHAYRDALLASLADQMQGLILFGSQARGDAHTDSDVDLLVLVDGIERKLPNGHYADPYQHPVWQTIMYLAYDVSLEYGVLLAPYVMSQERFTEWAPFTNQIKQEGISVWTKN